MVLVLVHSSVNERDSWLILYNIAGITDAAASKIRHLRRGLMNVAVCLTFQLTIACSFDAEEACIVPPVLSTLTFLLLEPHFKQLFVPG